MQDMRERPVDSIACPARSSNHDLFWLEERDVELHGSLPHGAPTGRTPDPDTKPGCIDPAAVTRLARRLVARISHHQADVVLLRHRPAARDLR